MADDNLTTEEIVTTITRTTSTPVETKTIESSTTTGTFAYLYWTGGSDPPSVDADDKDQTSQ